MYFGHIAMYTGNLERLTDFYCKYFGGRVFYDEPYGEMKSNYIAFGDKCYLELMQRPDVKPSAYEPGEEREGLTHIAIYANSSAEIIELSRRLENDGYTIVVQPTDYGTNTFFEACVLDPDGNRVEICLPEKILHAERGLTDEPCKLI